MLDSIKEPTHNRLIATFKAVGPYVREEHCIDGCYVFDCLSVCINDKKEPEKREFWGWWMELTKEGEHFSSVSRVGRYDSRGKWVIEEPGTSELEEVKRTHEVFLEKIKTALKEKFDLDIELNSL
ncbi:sigma factor-binding protein Crl [Vibrio salinus]|uniref:sigma factor-binding protein Crl n=1 Tax=Vibrio salinus TaxID=2899784 RepID=UPI001E3789EC|nr:sigma factor-binding protein Crl [Vibrio salinus]MCE0494368.1 sigma factor-binding protein Crl [Vibrio salinus]